MYEDHPGNERNGAGDRQQERARPAVQLPSGPECPECDREAKPNESVLETWCTSAYGASGVDASDYDN